MPPPRAGRAGWAGWAILVALCACASAGFLGSKFGGPTSKKAPGPVEKWTSCLGRWVTKEREYSVQCFTEVNETIQDVIKDTQSIDCGGEYAVAAGCVLDCLFMKRGELLKSGELSPDTPPIWPKTYRNVYVQVIYPSCNAYVSAVPMCSKTWTYKKCLKQRMNHRMKSMMGEEEVKGLISRWPYSNY
ncbi:hypothetical protein R5R35_008817 [Gryllus longicercus]|uniref:Odorant binding protein n=1 Tax=Gryllus longicercus TaxID=2509291 RepID=A0AAN9VAS2_9ORTH